MVASMASGTVSTHTHTNGLNPSHSGVQQTANRRFVLRASAMSFSIAAITSASVLRAGASRGVLIAASVPGSTAMRCWGPPFTLTKSPSTSDVGASEQSPVAGTTFESDISI